MIMPEFNMVARNGKDRQGSDTARYVCACALINHTLDKKRSMVYGSFIPTHHASWSSSRDPFVRTAALASESPAAMRH